jgi:small subunit ribosomal protein S9
MPRAPKKKIAEEPKVAASPASPKRVETSETPVKSEPRHAREEKKTHEEPVLKEPGHAPEPTSKAAEDDFVPEIPEEYADQVKRPERYFEAVGRRKTAIARVRMYTRSGDFTINEKKYGEYFPTIDLQKTVEDALQKMKLWGRFRVSVRAHGGGIHAQAEAVRHGLARCLIKFNPDFRKRLKRAGYLMRDPRAKERKKFGLKKARRAPQWAKR